MFPDMRGVDACIHKVGSEIFALGAKIRKHRLRNLGVFFAPKILLEATLVQVIANQPQGHLDTKRSWIDAVPFAIQLS